MVLIGPTAPDDEIAALAESAGDVPVIVADRPLDVPARGRRAHRRHGGASGSSSGTSSISATATSGTPAVTGYVSADPRLDGYLTAMAEQGLAERAHVVPAGGSAREGAAAAMRLLERGPAADRRSSPTTTGSHAG